jgi:dTDP-glucose pyrophosphorylase
MLKKVLICAAGRGTRMLHLSQNKPKHLIEINGKPFLYYVLKNLQDAGFEEFILVVGYKKEKMEEFAKEYQNEFKIQLVDQCQICGEEKYGTAMAVQCAQDAIGKENFILISGDNLYSVSDIKAMNINDDYNYIAGLTHSNPEKYGVLIKNKDGFLEKIIEKPQTYVGNLINTAMYKFTPEIFEKLPRLSLSPRGEYELTDAITMLASEGKVKVIEIKDYWKDFGRPEDVQIISEFLKNAK